MGGSRVEACRSFEGLAALRDQWEQARRRSREATVLNSFEHVSLWYRLFAAPDAVRVYPIRRDGETVGFLPLVAERRKGVRVLRSLTNAHCMHGEGLVADGQGGVGDLALAALAADRGWDVLRFEDEYSFHGDGLFPEAQLDASGLAWEKLRRPTFVIALDKPFDEYFRKDLSRKRRAYIMNYVHKVERAGAGYEHLRGAEAAAAWEEFVDIEDAGWKGTGGTSIRRETAAFRDYYRGLVALLAGQGTLRISFLTIGGRRIAGGFGHLQGGVFHLTKTGYREEFAQFAPSSLLLLELVRELGERRPQARTLHLFPFDFGYKHRFANDAAESVTTLVYNRTLGGRGARLWRALRARTDRGGRRPDG